MPFLSQDQAPVLEALERMKRARLVPFDVPGHKRGRGNPDLTEFLGQRCLDVDVNSMKMLDNLCHPVSVIKDAEALAGVIKKLEEDKVYYDEVAERCYQRARQFDIAEMVAKYNAIYLSQK